MTLIRYKNPENYLNNGFTGYKTFNEMVNDLFYRDSKPVCASCRPNANIYESGSEYRIELAVPGLDKKQVKLAVDNDLLKLYHIQPEDEGGKHEYTRKEFDYSNFERSFIIPENVDREKITAKYNNGILMVSLPIKEDQVKKGPKEIDVK